MFCFLSNLRFQEAIEKIFFRCQFGPQIEICVLWFQLIGMFLACCLSRYITNNQYEMV